MAQRAFSSCFIALVFVGAHSAALAQLVADGATSILDGVATNVIGGITVGTNGSFTSLILTNGATVANTGSGYLGMNANAQSNSVFVLGPGSSWSAGISFFVGQSGAFNQMMIMDGAVVSDSSATVGQNNSSSNNVVFVSGVGSLWTNSTSLTIGENGSGNQLVVTNGGTAVSLGATVGSLGKSNLVIVTGTNSAWRNRGISILGTSASASYNGLLIRDGGKVWNTGSCSVGSYSQTNFVLVTDPGTQWTNASYIALGGNGHGSQLVISNGAFVSADYTTVENNGGSLQQLTVTGSNSLLTNRSDFYLGQSGFSNRLVIANGGMLADNNGFMGWQIFSPGANEARVTDPNSIWTNRMDLYVGLYSQRSQLIVSNGAKVFDLNGHVGDNAYSSNNLVIVTDPGSLWLSRSYLYMGNDGPTNRLAINNGGTVVAENCYVGANTTSVSNLVTIDGGNFVISNGTLSVLQGIVILNAGELRASSLSAINKGMGRLIFNGGALRTFNTTLLFNGTPLRIGNGISAATFEMMLPGGTHRFGDGLVISSNAMLTGFGTIRGNVFVAGGGTLAPGTNDSITALTFNNGSLTLSNGSTTVIKLNAFSGAATHVDGLTNVSFGGTLQLTNVFGILADGTSFKLFNSSNYTGAFNSLTPATPGPGLKWNTNQLNVDGTLRVFSTNTPPPSFAGAQLSGSNLFVNIAGGIPHDPLFVLTTTNLGMPVANWQYIWTSHFDANGLAAFAIPIAPNDTSRFFSIQVK